MTRADAVGAEYAQAIEQAADRFADHEGMSGPRILNWMLQFSDEDLPLAAKVLGELTYFNATNLRGMTRNMVEMVLQEVQPTPSARVAFIPMSSKPGGGADTVARILRQMQAPVRPRVLTMVDLQDPPPDLE